MTTIKDKIKKEDELNGELPVKRKAGRPKKLKVEDGEGEKRDKKKNKDTDKSKKKPGKKNKSIETDGKLYPDDGLYSDDEEVNIGINIKSKIKANVDELINTVETLDADSGKEKNQATILDADININDRKNGAVEIINKIKESNTDIDHEKIIENNREIKDTQSSIGSDAVKKAIALVNADGHENLETSKKENWPVDDTPKITSRAIHIYKKITIFFAVLLLVSVFVVFSLTLLRVKITLIPSQERVSNNTIFDVIDLEKNKNAEDSAIEKITGIVKEVNIKHSKKYPATNEEVLGKEVVGKIEITNNYIKNQPLVASTRLLSSDGKLFRLKNTINIPAGGSVEAEIYADDPSPEMAIPPTSFTIPGLWAGLQDKIYGKSAIALEYRQKIKKTISNDDIEKGIKDLKQELLNNAKKEINDSYSNYDKIIYKIDENSVNSTVNNKIGEEIDEFEISIEAKVVIVAFDNKKFAEIAKDKLIKSLNSNKELVSFDDENINYSLNNFNILTGNANIGASFEGMTTLKNNSSIIKKEDLLGLDKAQINAYINEIDRSKNLDLAGHEIQFYPSFISKIYGFIEPGRIEIEIRK